MCVFRVCKKQVEYIVRRRVLYRLTNIYIDRDFRYIEFFFCDAHLACDIAILFMLNNLEYQCVVIIAVFIDVYLVGCWYH